MFLQNLIACNGPTCSNLCSKTPSQRNSPLKERSDHKCTEDFECFGYRVCNVDIPGTVGTCMNTCDAKTFVEVSEIDTYPSGGLALPKCAFALDDGNVYCKITDSTGVVKYIPPAKKYSGTSAGTVYVGGASTTHISDSGTGGNGLHLDNIKSTGNLDIVCTHDCVITDVSGRLI